MLGQSHRALVAASGEPTLRGSQEAATGTQICGCKIERAELSICRPAASVVISP